MNHSIDTHDRDAPIFAPDAFRLGDEEAALIAKARRFGARVLAPRAAQHDRDATFPIENFRDMHPEGLLAHLRAQGARRARRLVSAPIASPPPSSAATAARPRCRGTCMCARRCGPARSPTIWR